MGSRTTETYTLSLHDALPICSCACSRSTSSAGSGGITWSAATSASSRSEEHTSESSHRTNSYAVFCLKKKYKMLICRQHQYVVRNLHDHLWDQHAIIIIEQHQ